MEGMVSEVSRALASGDEDTMRVMAEHLQWKKGVPALYDFFKEETLDWPALTIEWLPGVEGPAGSDYTLQRLLLGTQTDGTEENTLVVAQIRIPGFTDDDGDEGAEEDDDVCVHEYTLRIPHEGEVNKARHMPQQPDIIASKSSVEGKVALFDLRKAAPKESKPAPMAVMAGTEDEGYALAWNAMREGYLISADAVVCVWDVNGAGADKPHAAIFSDKTAHTDVIEDACWVDVEHFVTVADDNTMKLWDLRTKQVAQTAVYNNHLNVVRCQPVSTAANGKIICGASDGAVLLFDTRKMSGNAPPLHKFELHKDEVFVLNFAPFDSNVFVSAGYDTRVVCWDMARMGRTQDAEDAEEGIPVEIVCQHGGHTNRVLDVSWNPNEGEDWVLASTQEGRNILHVWKPLDEIVEDDGEDEGASGEAAEAKPPAATAASVDGTSVPAASPTAAPIEPAIGAPEQAKAATDDLKNAQVEAATEQVPNTDAEADTKNSEEPASKRAKLEEASNAGTDPQIVTEDPEEPASKRTKLDEA
eukprot:NODE_1327_length_1779_cov_106.653382_g1260_i0.p1 GENE.NODE_1327_length_1779_cov_106.653382_g1260_i0~~NODE_1327_length_1779_cov_106.653382_g1260_i0.p1  ORF type:complete len:530 (-),score=126.59 NODE_1327_length_1779_cov_106.653382_g1260_i0:101-1690(-)